MKRFLILVVTMSCLFAISLSNVSADGPVIAQQESPDETMNGTPEDATVITGVDGANGLGKSVIRQVGSWTVEYSLAGAYMFYNYKKYVQHMFAKTARTAGAGNYAAEAHANLIKGNNYGGQQVFSSFTTNCAGTTVINGKAQTCASSWFRTLAGAKWFLISGHSLDIGINGSKDSTCDGCMDFVYTVP